MDENYREEKREEYGLAHFLIRLVTGTAVLFITAFLTPGFTISGLWTLLLAALVLAALDYFTVKILGANATPFGRGITGFLLAAVLLYITQYFVPGYEITLLGALLGALVYGIVDLIIPGKSM